MLFPQFLFNLGILFLGIYFYMSYYNTASQEESTIDADYLAASLTVESEKEIGSLDDILVPVIFFIYIFLWYFCFHF